jgi:WD40 repeat protein
VPTPANFNGNWHGSCGGGNCCYDADRTCKSSACKVTALKFSADGLSLAVGTHGQEFGGVTVYNLETTNSPANNMFASAFVPMSSTVLAVNFDPQGDTIVASTGIGRAVRTIDRDGTGNDWIDGMSVEAHGCSPVTGGEPCGASAVAFSPSRNMIASGGYDGTLRLWDASDLSLIGGKSDDAFTRQGSSDQADLVGSIFGIGWSPDGTRLLSGGESGKAAAWDGEVDTIIASHEAPLEHDATESLTSVAYSADGSYVATTSGDQSLRVWNAFTLAQVSAKTVAHSTDCIVTSAEFSSSLQENGVPILASTGYDGKIRLFQADDLACELCVLDMVESMSYYNPSSCNLASESGLAMLSWSPDGTKLAAAGFDHKIGIYTVSSGPWSITSSTIKTDGHSDAVRSIAWSPNGQRLVTASDDLSVKIWDTSLTLVDSVSSIDVVGDDGENGKIWSAHFSLDGERIVTATKNSGISVWDASDLSEGVLASLPYMSSGQKSVVKWSPLEGDTLARVGGGRLITAGDETGKVFIIQYLESPTQSLAVLLEKTGVHCGSCRVVHHASSPNGHRVVSIGYSNGGQPSLTTWIWSDELVRRAAPRPKRSSSSRRCPKQRPHRLARSSPISLRPRPAQPYDCARSPPAPPTATPNTQQQQHLCCLAPTSYTTFPHRLSPARAWAPASGYRHAEHGRLAEHECLQLDGRIRIWRLSCHRLRGNV